MQKWCPEPFAAKGPAAAFEAEGAAAPKSGTGRPFRPEVGFADTRLLLGQLTRDERAQVLDLVELDVRREYEARHDEKVAELKTEQAAAVAKVQEDAETWRRNLTTAVRSEVLRTLKELTRHTVDLAVTMAEKIVRERVAVDPEILARGIETVLYKVAAGVDLTITVHPDDAQRLDDAAELRRRLRVTAVKEDRRIQPGGCLVQADDLEWDATIQQQLDVMTEVIQDALAASISAGTRAGDDA